MFYNKFIVQHNELSNIFKSYFKYAFFDIFSFPVPLFIDTV